MKELPLLSEWRTETLGLSPSVRGLCGNGGLEGVGGRRCGSVDFDMT